MIFASKIGMKQFKKLIKRLLRRKKHRQHQEYLITNMSYRIGK